MKSRPYSLVSGGGLGNYVNLGASFVLDTSLPFAIQVEADLSSYYLTSVVAAGLINLKTDQGVPFLLFMQNTAIISLKIGGNSIFPVVVPINPNRRNALFKNGRHEIVIAFDGVDRTAASSYKIYIDGDDLTGGSGTTPSLTTHVNTLFILGASSSGRGDISRLRIWNGGTEMTEAQVKNLYYDDEKPTGPTLVREFLFTDGAGSQVTETVLGDHGTIVGSMTWRTAPLSDRTLASARTLSS